MAKVMKESELEKFKLNDEANVDKLPDCVAQKGIKLDEYKAMGKAQR